MYGTQFFGTKFVTIKYTLKNTQNIKLKKEKPFGTNHMVEVDILFDLKY